MRTLAPPTRELTRSRWVASCAVLVALVVAVIVLGDPQVFSGSDAGGKAATVHAMADRGVDGADLGYWAEDVDPLGDHHPIFHTEPREGGWIQVTSSAMPLASSVGARVAGALGALWLSILAVPIGALGAARLARRIGAPTGFLAFVVVGAASPLTFYGADQWEHAPALAAAIWAVALLGEKLRGLDFVWLGTAAGIAGALRRETVLVMVVLGVIELLDRERRQFWLRHVPGAAIAAGAAATILVVVYRLDAAVLGQSLSTRSADQAGLAGTEPGQRLYDGVLTTVSQYSNLDLPYSVIGVLTLVGVGLAASGWARNDDAHVRMGAMLAASSLAVRALVGGLTFVPGAFAAVPVAAAAPFLAQRRHRRLLVGCLVGTGLVILLQWTGSLGAQWGGRYLLVPAAVVAIVALAEIERRGAREPAALVALAATAAIAVLGLVWHVERSDGVAESRDAILAAADGEVVISTHAHFPREVAASLAEQRWLLGVTVDEVVDAFGVADRAATGERVWLLHPGTSCETDPCGRTWEERTDAEAPDGWRSTELIEVPWIIGGTYVLEAFEPG